MPSKWKNCIIRRHVSVMGGTVCHNPHFIIGTLFSNYFKNCCSINLNFLKGKTLIWYQLCNGTSHCIVSIKGGSRLSQFKKFTKWKFETYFTMGALYLWEDIEYNLMSQFMILWQLWIYKFYLSTLREWVGGS